MSLVDIQTLIKSRTGSSVHDGIEKAWHGNYKDALAKLGYPAKVAERVKINPEPSELEDDDIPVYMEIRSYRSLEGYKVSGKFDFVAEGQLEDFKNTGTFTWVNDSKTDDYILQGSIYRWLNPETIVKDTIQITFLFSDWMAFRAQSDPNYPKHPVMSKKYPLLSLEETETFMRNKIREIEKYKDLPQEDLPLCTDKELWRKDPQWKYYKNPQKTARSTKNFDNGPDAYARLAKDGNVGIVKEIPGEVVACKYCPAFPICTQKDDLIAEGSLIL